ncbi:hypothetical protein IVB43_34295 [Bradyrhizobium sp. 48]|uniref:hypothetical protein n=1 Tax=Bradyrhizobium sp. 48 TaxID=2782676 RepID=UPI001FFAC66B|nr:hypothetical protein [Bradyrhizobium sp. 48]MCK1447437.1 hypothetical protein [Bradyrhizobium sp. 48]
MAAAINPAEKSLIVVIELLLWMQQAKVVWLLQVTCGQIRISERNTSSQSFNAP